MIDPHVHLRDWNQKEKETLEHGLKVAYLAGITRLFDMPNTSPVITDRESALNRLADASAAIRKIRLSGKLSYSLYMGLTADKEQVRSAVRAYDELFPMVCGLKLFAGHSTGNMGLCEISQQELVFRTLTEEKFSGVLAVHAEKESLIRSDLFKAGAFETHSDARPAEAEIESVRDLISLAKKTGFTGHLHICHISTKGALELVLKAKEEGMNISCGATPHHLLLNRESAKEHSLYLKMNPPLRSEEDRSYLYQALLEGRIDNVESDHAPHTLEDKEKGASGIPGFEGMLLLLERLEKDGAGEEQLKALFGGNVLSIYGLEGEEVFLPKDIRSRIGRIRGAYPWDPYASLL